MKKQIVVRSFTPNSTKSADDLEKALKDGFQLVRASEFIPPQGNKVGYIEYILEKDENSPEEAKLKAELEKAKAEVEFLKAKSDDLEAQKNTIYTELNLHHLGIVKALAKLTECAEHTQDKHEVLYISAEGLHDWIIEVKKILEAASNVTEAEISAATEEGGTEC